MDRDRFREKIDSIPFAYTMSEMEGDLKEAFKQINGLENTIDGMNVIIKDLTNDNQRLQIALSEAVSQKEQLANQLEIFRAANETFSKN